MKRTRDFCLFQFIQTRTGLHLVYYPMDTGGFFSESKAARAWSWPFTGK